MEVLAFLIIVGGIVAVVRLGCRNGEGRVSKPSPVVCPVCGAKLELKEAGK